MLLKFALISLTVAYTCAESVFAAPAASKPNIVIINVDDLGWTDVTYMPNQKERFQTPHIKKLAESGMVFTNGYAACPVCSPTRASLVTGKSTAALKLTTHIPGNPRFSSKRIPKNAPYLPAKSLDHLPLKEVTFAEIAKEQGYKTAFIGKWHLAGAGSSSNKKARGSIAPKYHPNKQGFDINLGGCAYGQPASKYVDPHNNATLPDRKKGEYLTDRLTDEAVQFITNNKKKPFLLYLNFYSVHTPLAAPKDRVNLMIARGHKRKEATYAAMIESVDLAVGKLLTTLDKINIRKSTFILFTSDNGGLSSNEPLRDHKGTLYEGGIRVPFIASWQGVIQAHTTCDEPVISYDLLPTIASLTGYNKSLKDVEGSDLTNLFNQQDFNREHPLLWHYPHYHHGGMDSLDMGTAIRQGKWKYIYIYKTGKSYMYDLDKDLEEQNNLVKTHPEKADSMNTLLNQRLIALKANMPKKQTSGNQQKK